MCCDICPEYLECEEKKYLKEECCKRCPDYYYCQGNELDYDDNAEGQGYDGD